MDLTQKIISCRSVTSGLETCKQQEHPNVELNSIQLSSMEFGTVYLLVVTTGENPILGWLNSSFIPVRCDNFNKGNGDTETSLEIYNEFRGSISALTSNHHESVLFLFLLIPKKCDARLGNPSPNQLSFSQNRGATKCLVEFPNHICSG